MFGSNALGAIFGIGSGAALGTSKLLQKLGNATFHFTVVMFIQTYINVSCTLIIVTLIDEKFWSYPWKTYAKVVVVGALGVLSSYCANEAIKRIPLTDYIVILAISPTFVAIMESTIFRKKPTIVQIIQMIICYVGCVLCVQYNLHWSAANIWSNRDWLGYALAIVASLYTGFHAIALRYIEKMNKFTITLITSSSKNVFFSFYILSSAQSHIYSPGQWTSDLILLICSAFCHCISMYLLNLGIIYDGPLLTTIGRSCNVVVTLLYDFLFFGIPFDPLRAFGSLMVVFGIAVPSIWQLWKMRNRTESNSD